MKQRLKICHVITRMIIGGAQENTLLTCRGLVEKGHDVTLLTGPTDGPEGKLLEKYQVPGLRIVEEPTLVREISPWTDLRSIFRLQKFFEKERFDVVHTHSSKAGVSGRIAARRAGVPLVMHTVHGQAFHQYQSRLKNAIYILGEKVAARYCDRILAVAQAMIDQCVAAGVAPREKYAVNYSGMDLQSFLDAKPDPELRARLGIPAGVPVVGKIARLFELKGYEHLIEAAPAIVQAVPNVRFLIVGDGKHGPLYKQMIAEKGLTSHFAFAGLVPPHEVPRYTALMDALVHLSLREGLPRTVVQALAAGKPAVGYALDGTPEVILDGKTGFLCQPGDVRAVEKAVIRLLTEPGLAGTMGSAGRELVRVRFDWHTMTDQIEQEYFSHFEKQPRMNANGR